MELSSLCFIALIAVLVVMVGGMWFDIFIGLDDD